MDCCSQTDTVPAVIINAEFFCPKGTVPWEGCDPNACACDVSERDGQSGENACVFDCCRGSDILWSQSCVDGDWLCKGGVPFSECADVTCSCESRRVWLGDRCDGEDMYCELAPRVFDECQPMACQTCEGADLPAEADGCACHCTEAQTVQCERVGD